MKPEPELTPDACATIFAQHLTDNLSNFGDHCPLEAALCHMGAPNPHVDFHWWGNADEDGVVENEIPLPEWAERLVRIADARTDRLGCHAFTGEDALTMLDAATLPTAGAQTP